MGVSKVIPILYRPHWVRAVRCWPRGKDQWPLWEGPKPGFKVYKLWDRKPFLEKYSLLGTVSVGYSLPLEWIIVETFSLISRDKAPTCDRY
jgi:hypothetical protein